ncbi:MAG TPA: glutathione S-transferase family protein [Solirubrobacterales bacterium]|nr:glutathione S-transferase family protein [Solirubrobacterales bacterium]
MSPSDKPVLWHIGVSHYSEKVRWALDWKDVEHERREPPPPIHMGLALWWSRGETKTFPVLELYGERILDSTAIIGALEARYPEPPLYPEDPAERRRALDLEDYFDENLGPAVRLFGWHHLRQDSELLGKVTEKNLPGPVRNFGPARAGVNTFASTFANLRFKVSDPAAEAEARRVIDECLDRLENELGDGEHLVGDTFSVADLTAAALLYPLVLPPEGPQGIQGVPATAQAYEDELRQRPSYEWVQQTFANYRKPVRERAAV